MKGKKQVHACLITNARSARGGPDLSDAILVLKANGWDVEVRQKEEGGEATDLARSAEKEGFDVVCGCGGDGTLSEITDGLVNSDVALGVLPGGTENVWSREIGVSRNLRMAATQLVNSLALRVDVGRARVNGNHAKHFLLMAGLGADGAVMQRVSRSLKNRIGPLAVGVAGIESVGSIGAVPISVELDGVQWQGKASEIVIGNTRLYGGFTRITPGAYINDGLLDVCIVTADRPADAVRQMASLVVRKRPADSSAETYRAGRITVRAPCPLPMQLDGSAVDQSNHQPQNGVTYELEALHGALNVLVPREYDGELFERVPLEQAAPYAAHHLKNGKNGKKRNKKLDRTPLVGR